MQGIGYMPSSQNCFLKKSLAGCPKTIRLFIFSTLKYENVIKYNKMEITFLR
jgi:hypothetical protein